MVEQLGIKGDFPPFSGTAALSAGFKAPRMTWIPFVVQMHFLLCKCSQFYKNSCKGHTVAKVPWTPHPASPEISISPNICAKLVTLPTTVVLSTLVAFKVPFLFLGPVWGAP